MRIYLLGVTLYVGLVVGQINFYTVQSHGMLGREVAEEIRSSHTTVDEMQSLKFWRWGDGWRGNFGGNNNEAVILAQAMDASPVTAEQWSACAVFTFNNGCGPDYLTTLYNTVP